MSSMMNSQGLVLATAMAVSAGTVFLFEVFRDKNNFAISQSQQESSSPDSRKVLKSCLCTESKKNEKKKKKVKFAKDVKDSNGNGELYRKQHGQRIKHAIENGERLSCGKESQKRLGTIPANRMALYNGILKSRVQYSH